MTKTVSPRTRRLCSLYIGVLGVTLLGGGALAASAKTQDPESVHAQVANGPGTFTVKDGKVDPNTYQGYLTYTRNCQACHGPDGMGSSFAPSLVQAAERRSFAEIAQTIAGGLQIQPGRVMPSFAEDPNVIGNIGNIYSYLKARASGELGRGRPKVLEELQEAPLQKPHQDG